MFDTEKPRVSLKNEEKPPKVGRSPVLWEHMTEAERLAHYQDLREFLPRQDAQPADLRVTFAQGGLQRPHGGLVLALLPRWATVGPGPWAVLPGQPPRSVGLLA